MGRGLIVLILIVVVLVATNPSRAELNDWARTYVARKIEAEARKRGEDPNDGSALVGGAIAGFVITNMPIERRNLLVLSIYEIKLPARAESGEEKSCSVLGIAGQFVALSGC